MRILVVDDDPNARMIAEILLGAYGRCQCADCGEQGLAQFEKAHQEGDPYSLIAVDIKMPGISGYDVVKRIRGYEEKHGISLCNVIMVTVMDDMESISTAFWQGCQGYVVKPITAYSLQNALEHLCIEPLEQQG